MISWGDRRDRADLPRYSHRSYNGIYHPGKIFLIMNPESIQGPRHHDPRAVFSIEKAAGLDTRLRHLIYRPDQLAERIAKPGNRVLDFGCGPGFFTRGFAKRVGENGQVVSADLQAGMLAIVRQKMDAEGLGRRVKTHQCRPDSIGLPKEMNGTFDTATAIFVVHEVPDPEKLFREIASLLRPGGTFFFSEPPFLVPGREFAEKIALAESCGFRLVKRSWYFVNRAATFTRG